MVDPLEVDLPVDLRFAGDLGKLPVDPLVDLEILPVDLGIHRVDLEPGRAHPVDLLVDLEVLPVDLELLPVDLPDADLVEKRVDLEPQPRQHHQMTFDSLQFDLHLDDFPVRPTHLIHHHCYARRYTGSIDQHLV